MIALYYLVFIVVITTLFIRIERFLPVFVFVFSLATLYLFIGLNAHQLIVWIVALILTLVNLVLFVPFF